MNLNVNIVCELSAKEAERIAGLDRQKMDSGVYLLLEQFTRLARGENAESVISYICKADDEEGDEGDEFEC